MISKNFKMSEFAVSSSYPHLVEPVPEKYKQNVIDLVQNVLQPICDATGWRDYISSGYRPDKLNKAVGGSLTSDHRYARAADNNFYQIIQGKKFIVQPIEVAQQVKKLGLCFDQMILYPTFIHLSYRAGANRNEVLYNKSYKGKKL